MDGEDWFEMGEVGRVGWMGMGNGVDFGDCDGEGEDFAGPDGRWWVCDPAGEGGLLLRYIRT